MDYRKYQVKRWILNPEKSALLVIDMQNYFLDITHDILGNVKRLITAFRKRKLPVVFTQHTHKNIEVDGGLLVQWWGRESMEVFSPGKWEWEIINEIKPLPNEIVINDKTRYSAFYKTSLEAILRKEKVEEIVICGVMTNYCCETTARDAFNRDFKVFFVEDATATDDPFLHQATLCNLASGFATIVSTKEIIGRISKD